MPSQETGSASLSPHTVIVDVSVLFGTAIFLAQMWGGAPLEHTLVTASGAGVAGYVILAAGYAAGRGIVENGVPFGPDEAPSTNESAGEAEADDPENAESVPEAQAA